MRWKRRWVGTGLGEDRCFRCTDLGNRFYWGETWLWRLQKGVQRIGLSGEWLLMDEFWGDTDALIALGFSLSHKIEHPSRGGPSNYTAAGEKQWKLSKPPVDTELGHNSWPRVSVVGTWQNPWTLKGRVRVHERGVRRVLPLASPFWKILPHACIGKLYL